MKMHGKTHMTTRKVRLMPNRAQAHALRRFMGTCRWTYNQGVAHFRATGSASSYRLANLYVTRTTQNDRSYPENQGPPPPWAHETPCDYRSNTMRRLAGAVKAAFTNISRGNIRRFNINFVSKKQKRYFPITCSALHCSSGARDGETWLSIAGIAGIRVLSNRVPSIGGAVTITNEQGFWYACIPSQVGPQTHPATNTTVALDPGIKCFLTGFDTSGNAFEIEDQDGKATLSAKRGEIRDIQVQVAAWAQKRWRYKAYAKAKRTLSCASAKLSNLVKDLHRKATAYLTNRYTTILLPSFRTTEMLKRSCARNHEFNKNLLSLKHFQFRQYLTTKCARKGIALVVCSEMYTSRTCARCNESNLALGSLDVFDCPH